MSAPAAGPVDVQVEEFDVIAACQRWLELDFPGQSDADPPENAPAQTGDPR